MKAERFLDYWYKGAAVVGLIVGAVAALLLAIIATARSIQANAERIIAVAEEIVANTQALWKLAETDTAASQVLSGARGIEEQVSEVADALEAPRADAK